MNYKTVKLPADFIDEVKNSATEEFRSVSQQLLYWATLGRNVAQSYFTDEDDSELGQLALKRYQEEKHLAVKVSLNDFEELILYSGHNSFCIFGKTINV